MIWKLLWLFGILFQFYVLPSLSTSLHSYVFDSNFWNHTLSRSSGDKMLCLFSLYLSFPCTFDDEIVVNSQQVFLCYLTSHFVCVYIHTHVAHEGNVINKLLYQSPFHFWIPFLVVADVVSVIQSIASNNSNQDDKSNPFRTPVLISNESTAFLPYEELIISCFHMLLLLTWSSVGFLHTWYISKRLLMSDVKGLFIFHTANIIKLA